VRRLRRVSKDETTIGASWFETALTRLLTMRVALRLPHADRRADRDVEAIPDVDGGDREQELGESSSLNCFAASFQISSGTGSARSLGRVSASTYCARKSRGEEPIGPLTPEPAADDTHERDAEMADPVGGALMARDRRCDKGQAGCLIYFGLPKAWRLDREPTPL